MEAIRIVRQIKDICGKEDKDYVKFRDGPKGIEIYILTNTTQEEAMISHRISEFLIKFCNITSIAQRNPVLPIVAYSHQEIQKLLEEYNLTNLARTRESFSSGDVSDSDSSGSLSYPIVRNQRARTPDLHTRMPSFGGSGTPKLRAKSKDCNLDSDRSTRRRDTV